MPTSGRALTQVAISAPIAGPVRDDPEVHAGQQLQQAVVEDRLGGMSVRYTHIASTYEQHGPPRRSAAAPCRVPGCRS